VWAVRDAGSEVCVTGGDHVGVDGGRALARRGGFACACRAALAGGGGEALFYGHIGDGNMHIVASVPGAAAQPKDAICAIVYGLVGTFNGTVSAEHGIGTLKKDFLPLARSAEEIALMRRVKAALDPDGILNPGKVF
jgi:FAD/FMN-containing dehydrogenase